RSPRRSGTIRRGASEACEPGLPGAAQSATLRQGISGETAMGEFKAFIMRGNVLDLAVAVIIGAAFGAIVASLTGDVIMPAIGAMTGGLDFSNYYVLLGAIPPDYKGAMSYAALKAAGVPMFGY